MHAAAARGHEGDRLLVWMFALCAAAQVLWAAAAVIRPIRPVLVAGLIINGGAVLVWALTRTVGIPFIDSLAEVESAGTQDLAAALFASASVLGAARMLARPVARVVIAPGWAGALAVFALLAAMPALQADHTHGHGDDLHLEAAGHAHGVDDAANGIDHAAHDDADHAPGGDEAPHGQAAAGDGHGHGTAEVPGEGDHAQHEGATGDLVSHGHATTDGTIPHSDHPADQPADHPADHPDVPDAPDHPHPPADPDDPAPSGPIISLDDPRLTDAQRAIATKLIADVRGALAVYPNVAAVEAAGYISIGDGGVEGYEHFVNWSYLSDGIELNPSKIESIVVKKSAGGAKTIVSGMFILNLGKTMANIPPLAGELTTWHDHQNLCFEGTRLVGLAVGGVCSRGVLTPTPPMLHVWLVDHPCGPFAGIDSHGGSCGVHDDH